MNTHDSKPVNMLRDLYVYELMLICIIGYVGTGPLQQLFQP